MECKFILANDGITHGKIELIDTLWNVNDRGREYKTRTKSELIDTLWNVNIRFDTAK